jgi:hypothetical protein
MFKIITGHKAEEVKLTASNLIMSAALSSFIVLAASAIHLIFVLH